MFLTQILTLQTWRGKILKKEKNGYSSLLNKQQLKKVQRRYINIFLNNEKNEISDRHWVLYEYN